MSFRNRLTVIQRRLQTCPGAGSDRTLPQDLLLEAHGVGRALVDGDWEALRRRSMRCLGLGMAAYSVLRGEAPRRTSDRPVVIARVLQHAYRSIVDSPNRAELIEKLRAATEEAGGADAVARLRDSLAAFSEGKLASAPIWRALSNQPPLKLPLPGADESAAAVTRGLLGLIHYEFNRAFPSWDARAAVLTDHVMLRPALAELVATFTGELRACQAAIQGALVWDSASPRVHEEIRRLVDLILTRAPGFARAQAAAHRAVTALREAGRGAAAEEIGALAASAGGVTREAVASVAAGLRLSLDLARTGSGSDDVELAASARRLPFDMPLPNGRDLSLRHLADASEDDFVEVRAVVETVTVARDGDGKLISQLGLIDPSSGARAKAAAIFVDWRHAGLTRGSFCRFSATFHQSLPQLGSAPGLLIDRLSESQLADAFWRFRFIRSARRWFDPFRNGHNMVWSLGPHDTAASLEDSDAVGAAELVFVKLLS